MAKKEGITWNRKTINIRQLNALMEDYSLRWVANV